ncbi:sigma-54-dependent Fis family transcriptional regulator [Litorimonas cladophorae]|uniref:Sigma-54-dependent Fis family transcriptional regulator n=1 Tax=Litorimonas cladophorae TaxID=1220491 RepID=A0A918NK68_9PROT|nr:sigma 54-interacting transcriptional regulator [Litorimonas cladophorae]GGX73890.1 sigma-54-dependent Fis family transcriptional regulator [Litorimonas cladophorae]
MAALPPQPIGQSQSYLAILDRVSDSAVLERPVLIVGERGTGKELIAKRLHFLSPRWEKVFLTVNCAAFTDERLDEEFFGQSFLDGRDDTNGKFYHADEGTIFLDNVDSVSPRLQEKLMGAIEYGRYEASGEHAEQEVDVRVIAASAVDLPAAVARGDFRADLLDRLAFEVMTLPPLRARRDDILPLADHFGKKIAAELGADRFPGFTAEASEQLLDRNWVGNVRELKTIVERNTAQAWLADETLKDPIGGGPAGPLQFDPFESPHRLRERRPQEMPSAPKSSLPQTNTPMPAYTLPPLEKNAPHQVEPLDFQNRVLTFERKLIDEALHVSGNHQGKAAEHLGLSYHQFRGLMRKHGLKK